MSLETFQASVLAACRGLWGGQTDNLQFADQMFSALRRGYEQAWQEGAKECGVLPDERTQEETNQLGRMIGDNFQYVANFGQWIFEHNKASGTKFESIRSRANQWINRYDEVKTISREMACADQKETWLIGKTEAHCCDCLRMHGRTYRNSIWRKYDIHPKSAKLACFGGHCDCHRIPTNAKVTKGKPPALRGPGGCGKVKKKEAA